MSHIRYDGSGELHITNITEAAQMDKTDIDRVISTCQDSIEDNISDDMIYSHYCMSDGRPEVEREYGGSCEYDGMFEDAADELHLALQSDERVLIHCHAGISRSVSVAAAALGRLLDIGRSEALDLIHTYRITHAYPDGLLMDHTRSYIEENTSVNQRPFSEE